MMAGVVRSDQTCEGQNTKVRSRRVLQEMKERVDRAIDDQTGRSTPMMQRK